MLFCIYSILNINNSYIVHVSILICGFVRVSLYPCIFVSLYPFIFVSLYLCLEWAPKPVGGFGSPLLSNVYAFDIALYPLGGGRLLRPPDPQLFLAPRSVARYLAPSVGPAIATPYFTHPLTLDPTYAHPCLMQQLRYVAVSNKISDKSIAYRTMFLYRSLVASCGF